MIRALASRAAAHAALGRAVLAVAPIVCIVACYRPDIGDGSLHCEGTRCPRGFTCGTDSLCWRPEAGSSPAGSAGRDAGPADVTAGSAGRGVAGAAGTATAGTSGSAGTVGAAGMTGTAGRGGGGAGTSGNAGTTGTAGTTGGSVGTSGTAGTTGAAGASAAGRGGGAGSSVAGGGGRGGITATAGAGGSIDAGASDHPRSDLGASCEGASDCASGFCADGVCCDGACGGSCKACNLPGTPGRCSDVPAGAPPRHPSGAPTCAAQIASSCGADGTCDGRGGCRMWSAGTVCKPAACDGQSNRVTYESQCNGSGSCVAPPSSSSCSPFGCNATLTGCAATCSAAIPCATGYSCVDSSCGAKPKGSSCAADDECMSAMCVDHVCCTSRCGGTCEACDLGATRGDCAAVTAGQPHGSRGTCGGSGACAGGCSAASRTQCTFPDATTSCSCPTVPLSLATCDGTGHCATVSGLCL